MLFLYTVFLMQPISPAPGAPKQRFPLFASKVSAGFPSPADDYIEARLDLNELLVTHKEATFFMWSQGDSMKNANIIDGDLLIVNRAIVPAHCDIVVAVVNAELTIKFLFKKRDVVKLVAANDAYPEITIQPDNELIVWGVVTHVIHSFRKSVRAR
jgi:DNA polymerase V